MFEADDNGAELDGGSVLGMVGTPVGVIWSVIPVETVTMASTASSSDGNDEGTG